MNGNLIGWTLPLNYNCAAAWQALNSTFPRVKFKYEGEIRTRSANRRASRAKLVPASLRDINANNYRAKDRGARYTDTQEKVIASVFIRIFRNIPLFGALLYNVVVCNLPFSLPGRTNIPCMEVPRESSNEYRGMYGTWTMGIVHTIT